MTSDRKESSPREARARDRVRLRLLDPPHQARLADAAVLVVVPDHDLVGRVARVAAAADEGEDVAAEEHLDDPNPAVGKVCGTTGQLTSRVRLRCVWIRGGTREADNCEARTSAVGLSEGVAVEDAEARVRPAREAAIVLVEADV